MKEIDIPQIIAHLMADSSVSSKIDKVYWGSPVAENKPKPYVTMGVVTDIPDPLRTRTRLEIRVVAHNDKVKHSELQAIDNAIKTSMLSTMRFGDFEIYNIIVEQGRPFQEDKKRKSIIRDYIILFIN